MTRLGPFGVFLLMVPESACIPVPSEITLLAAGFAVHQGWMPFSTALAAATAGNLVGSLIAYGVGRLTSGTAAAGSLDRGLARCDELFARHGIRAVFLARLMPLARTFVSLPAGHARVAVAPFVFMTTVGCVLWASGFLLLGMLLGGRWTALSGSLGDALLVLGLVVLVAALRRRRGDRR